MKYVTIGARLLLGLVFFGGGIAFFFTTPPPLEGAMATFFNGLVASKYFFYLLKGTEITCGLALLTGYFVPLALVVLAPVVLNIFMVHTFLEPSGLIQAVVIGVFAAYLAFFTQYSPKIKALFKAK